MYAWYIVVHRLHLCGGNTIQYCISHQFCAQGHGAGNIKLASENVYTMEIGKYHKPGLLWFSETQLLKGYQCTNASAETDKSSSPGVKKSTRHHRTALQICAVREDHGRNCGFEQSPER